MCIIQYGLRVLVFVIALAQTQRIEDLSKHLQNHPQNHHESFQSHFLFKSNNSIDGSIGSLIKALHGTDTYLLIKDSLPKLYALINITTECKNATAKLINDIRKNFRNPKVLISLPGVKMIDAWGKIPEKILLGNMLWMGAYGECTDTPGAKYCATPIVLGPMVMTYGSCFPVACTTTDVAAVMSQLKLKNIMPLASASKCNEPVTYTKGAVITMVILSVVIFLNVAGTFVDVLHKRKAAQTYDIDHDSGVVNERFEPDVTPNHSLNASDKSNAATPMPQITADRKVEAATPCSILIRILTCFSLPKNIEGLLSTDAPKGTITSLNGIRFFSMTWVVLGHYYAFNVLGNRPDNLVKAMTVTQRFSFQAVANAFVSVDSFFLFAGLLTAYLTFKKRGDKTIGLKEILLMYLHRYIRLTPTLALVILFQTNVYPDVLSGPGKVINEAYMTAAPELVPDPQENCYNYWWATLLYFNNLYPENAQNCFGLAWYLANDFQFFALSPFVISLMIVIHRKWSRTAAIVLNFFGLGTLCFISIVITGIITGVYNIDGLLVASLLPGNPRKDQAKWIMERLYVKPYTRITPYLVGIFLGYIINKDVNLKGKNGRWISAFGWSIAAAGASLVIYGPYSVYKQGGEFFTDAENILYSATHRFVWACTLAWLIYACHNNYGGWVDSFLSWRVWTPVSRLTYGGYLLHMMVMGYFMQIREVPYHYQDSTAVQDFISIIIVTYGCSFVLALLVEYPISKLEKIIFGR